MPRKPCIFLTSCILSSRQQFYACSHLLRLCRRVCVAKTPSMAICPEFCDCARQWEVWLASTYESASPAVCRWSEYGSMRKQRPGRWLLCCITFPHNTKERLVKQQSPQWCVDNMLRRLASLSCLGTSYLITLEMYYAMESSHNKQLVICVCVIHCSMLPAICQYDCQAHHEPLSGPQVCHLVMLLRECGL